MALGDIDLRRVEATIKSSSYLSPPHRPVCVIGRLERSKKESARGAMGRIKRGREASPAFFPLPIVPRVLAIFFYCYCYFQWDTLRELPRRRERVVTIAR